MEDVWEDERGEVEGNDLDVTVVEVLIDGGVEETEVAGEGWKGDRRGGEMEEKVDRAAYRFGRLMRG